MITAKLMMTRSPYFSTRNWSYPIRRLTASPLILKFKMDEDNDDQELTMVAENLGRIPPNTSLMVVEAGEQRYEVRITSTEQKNAVVRFKYQKP